MVLHLRGEVLPDGKERDVYVVEGRITFEADASAQTILSGGYLLPGLVDCHAHLALASPAPTDLSAEEQIRASAEAQLAVGVLALREPGSLNRLSNGLGPQVGLPRTFSAGRFLTAPGMYFPGLAEEATGARLPDAAAAEARASGQWVKIIGDFWDASGDVTANFEPHALAEAAARVHALGARIAIHALQTDVIEAAIAAGFDSIEHGVLLQAEHIQEMARRNIAWVPTLIIRHEVPELAGHLGSSAAEVERIQSGFDRQPAMVRRAVDAGVLVLAGTDAGLVPHGVILSEIKELLGAGLTPTQALGAASWDARSFLGLPGIEEGAVADLVAYASDPRLDPEVLQHPVVRILDGVNLAR